MKGWGPELCARRLDITVAMVNTFLTNMYGGVRADFVYTDRNRRDHHVLHRDDDRPDARNFHLMDRQSPRM